MMSDTAAQLARIAIRVRARDEARVAVPLGAFGGREGGEGGGYFVYVKICDDR